jgi:hypothetical protein
VSVLLRQPHGFESLGRVHIDVPSDDPSAAKRPNVPDPLVYLHVAVLAVRAGLNGCHDVIAAVDELYGHPVEVLERLEHLPRTARQAVVTVERPLGPEEGCTLPDLDGWIEELEDPGSNTRSGRAKKLVVEPE